MSKITAENPGPFVIPKASGLRDQSLCLDAKRAITKYLFLGEQVGEPDLMLTYDIVYPFVRAWKASADQVAMKGLEERLRRKLDFNDPLFSDIQHMTERSTFYMETLEAVKDEGLEEQRRVIFGYVVNPLFRGIRYKVYFDAESGEINTTSDYCTPMRIANHLDYAVNVYRELTGITLPDVLQAMYRSHESVTQDWMEDVMGPAEKHQRAFEEDIRPILKNARDAAHAATHVAVSLAKASNTSTLLVGAAVASVALFFLSRKR